MNELEQRVVGRPWPKAYRAILLAYLADLRALARPFLPASWTTWQKPGEIRAGRPWNGRISQRPRSASSDSSQQARDCLVKTGIYPTSSGYRQSSFFGQLNSGGKD